MAYNDLFTEEQWDKFIVQDAGDTPVRVHAYGISQDPPRIHLYPRCATTSRFHKDLQDLGMKTVEPKRLCHECRAKKVKADMSRGRKKRNSDMTR